MSSYTPLELAEAYMRAGELEDALDALNQHLQSQQGDDAARRMRAQVLAQLGMAQLGTQDSQTGHLREALADLSALNQQSPDDVARRIHLLTQLGEGEAAHKLLHDLWKTDAKIGRDARVVEMLLESLYRRGEAAQAIQILFDQPKTWRWLRWNGDFHALKGDHRVALDYYCSALDQLEESTQDAPPKAQSFVHNLRAQILLRRAEMYKRIALYAEAEADYLEAEVLIPTDATIPFLKGLVVFLGGDTARAKAICREALAKLTQESVRAEMLQLVKNESRYAALEQELGA